MVLGEKIGLREDVIQKACKLSMKAHDKSPAKPYVHDKNRSSREAFFAFPGSWAVECWYDTSRRKAFGDVQVDTSMFPSLKSIGTEDIAVVNEAFSRRFDELLIRSSLVTEVEKAMHEKKQIIFAGHSSGGPLAILATIWFFEKYIRPNPSLGPLPWCVTFGSPLVGNRTFSHALRRENWASYFIHFVTKYDIVPRITLAPLSKIQPVFQPVLDFLNPKSPLHQNEVYGKSSEASTFLVFIMRNALSVTSHAACNLKGCTNLLLETVPKIFELSPYRPFGTYIFCTGSGKFTVLDNSDAVLQMLFYCLQMSPQEENMDFVYGMFKEHLAYESVLHEGLNMQDVTYLENLTQIPLSSDALTNDAAALKDLGLSTRARLCLRAAGELEKQKHANQERVYSKRESIMRALNSIQEYKTNCEIRRIGYYDAFKLQKDEIDFKANVIRLELAGIWDEIIEMIRRYELPDGFEGRKEWIELGTIFRRLVEPLDIANYYRHLKNEDTGPYMLKARPRRYKFPQKWREHIEIMQAGASSESTFWAKVEELRVKPYEEVKNEVLELEQQALTWVQSQLLGKDVFFNESTFTKWWRTLPYDHRARSCISAYINT